MRWLSRGGCGAADTIEYNLLFNFVYDSQARFITLLFSSESLPGGMEACGCGVLC